MDKKSSTHNVYPSILWHCAADDNKKLYKRLLDPNIGPHLYFRRIKTAIQARYAELSDHHTIPKVFLCGNPHVDNSIIIGRTCMLTDFDRAYIGPYSWDLVCLLLSLSLKQAVTLQNFVNSSVSDALKEAYMEGFHEPEKIFTNWINASDANHFSSTTIATKVIDSRKKWCKKMRKHPLSTKFDVIQALLKQYFTNHQQQDLLQQYTVKEAGRAFGTFGRPRFIVLLTANNTDNAELLLDIKVTRDYLHGHWPHLHFYTHDFQHEAQRVINARRLYTPHYDQQESFATLYGEQYWCRVIPTTTHKIKGLLSNADQIQLATVFGQQLGRGHRLSLQEQTVQQHMEHFKKHYVNQVACARQMYQEILLAHQDYQQGQ